MTHRTKDPQSMDCAAIATTDIQMQVRGPRPVKDSRIAGV
jgi:hypothetical protein